MPTDLHVSYEFLAERTPPGKTFTAYLAEGEAAWNPASTKRLLYGPAVVTYTHHVDGGWHAHVEEA